MYGFRGANTSGNIPATTGFCRPSAARRDGGKSGPEWGLFSALEGEKRERSGFWGFWKADGSWMNPGVPRAENHRHARRGKNESAAFGR